jgi:hypothetical protein
MEFFVCATNHKKYFVTSYKINPRNQSLAQSLVPPKVATELKKKIEELDAAAHICNPTYSEGGDQENRGSGPAWTKRFARFHLNQ